MTQLPLSKTILFVSAYLEDLINTCILVCAYRNYNAHTRYKMTSTSYCAEWREARYCPASGMTAVVQVTISVVKWGREDSRSLWRVLGASPNWLGRLPRSLVIGRSSGSPTHALSCLYGGYGAKSIFRVDKRYKSTFTWIVYRFDQSLETERDSTREQRR